MASRSINDTKIARLVHHDLFHRQNQAGVGPSITACKLLITNPKYYVDIMGCSAHCKRTHHSQTPTKRIFYGGQLWLSLTRRHMCNLFRSTSIFQPSYWNGNEMETFFDRRFSPVIECANRNFTGPGNVELADKAYHKTSGGNAEQSRLRVNPVWAATASRKKRKKAVEGKSVVFRDSISW